MKNLLTLVLCYFLFLFSADAQTNLSHAWSKGFPNQQILGSNTEATSIATDAAGNSYVIGFYQNTVDMDPGAGVANVTSTGSGDIYFGKYDASGALVFAKSIGGPGNDAGNKIEIDGSGNIYITGSFSGTSDFDPSANTATLTSVGLNDFFFAKYDANGNYIFAKAMGGLNNEEGKCIDFDAANNIYIGGNFETTVDFDPGTGTANLTSLGSSDIFIAKYDANGNYVYAKAIGGASYEAINGIALDASNNIYISGYIQSPADFDPGAGIVNLNTAGLYDIYIAKYDASCNYVFAKTIGGTDYDQSNGIDVDASGNIYITGWFRTPTVDFDPGAGIANLTKLGSDEGFIAKYSTTGNYIYAALIGGTNYEEGSEIIVDASNYVYVIGTFGGTVDFDPGAGTVNLSSPSGYGVFIVKYDAGINYQFAVGVGASMRGNDVSVDASGKVYAVGMFSTLTDFDPGAPTANLTPPGLQNGFVASYTNTGAYRFAGQIGGYYNTAYSELGNTITTDAAGNVYVAGTFSGNVDFDPGPGTAFLFGSTNGDIFFAKYDANGNYVFAKAINGSPNKEPKTIALDATGNIFIAGYFQSNVDFDPGAGFVSLTSAGSDDIFIAKYDVNGNYVFVKQIGGTGSDRANGMMLDGSGNIFIAGNYTGAVDFDPSAAVASLSSSGGSQDIFFAKYDASGNYLFAKGTGGTGFDAADGICLDASGNLCIAGRFQGTADFDPTAVTVNLISAGNYDVFIAKYNTTGGYVYAKRMGGPSDEQPTAMTIDGSNNIYITGAFQGTADFDPGGPVVNLVSIGSYEIFFAKYDASGNYVYAKSLPGSGFDFGRSIIVDNSNNVYVVGEFANSIDLDAGGGIVSATAAGGADFFITKYDALGNYVYAKSIGGAASDNCYDITKDAAGNLLITGRYGSMVDFDPNANTAPQTSLNSVDFFIAKYTECSGPIMASYSMRAATITISGATSLTDGGCSLLSTIAPNGGNPISGAVNGKVWIEASVPVYGGKPFVARHYEITPSTNPTTATARVTLYFTQLEFDNFNAHAGSSLDLPTNSSDALGKSNLRIGKYSGTSNNGSGQPNSYTGTAEIIDPNDADIIWNSSLNRWEVSFDVSGFSGFIVQTHNNLLPLTLLEFKGELISNNASLSWKTENEQNTSHFDIERSKDGKNFNEVGRVKSVNNHGTHQYHFADQNISSLNVPVVYYRLKQTDIDGRSTYSSTIALSINPKESIVMLRPNPVQNAATLAITTKQRENIVCRIIDNSGRIIKSVDVSLQAGSNIVPISTNGLSAGVYMIDIRGTVTNGQVRLLKL